MNEHNTSREQQSFRSRAVQWIRSRMEAQRPRQMQAFNRTRGTVIASELHGTWTSAERRKGLLGRDSMREGEGMWIVPSQAVHTFFMRFPIDLVFLDRKRRVRKIRRAVPAWRIAVCFTASSVLELPVGTIDRSGTRKGDQVDIVRAEVAE